MRPTGVFIVRYSWIDLALLLAAIVILIPLSMDLVETAMKALQGVN